MVEVRAPLQYCGHRNFAGRVAIDLPYRPLLPPGADVISTEGTARYRQHAPAGWSGPGAQWLREVQLAQWRIESGSPTRRVIR